MSAHGFDPGSRSKLTPRDVGRFPSDSLADRLGRAVCEASCLPRKELFEAWEMAKRVRRRFRGGRVVDLAAGHGLLAHALLLLDDSSPRAIVVDRRLPRSAEVLRATLAHTWPRLEGRVTAIEDDLESLPLAPGDLVVSAHACGALTDVVLARAVDARARVAVLPCCHDAATCDAGGLGGWLEPSLAIDAARALRLRDRGYDVWTQTIPSAITPKNRLLLGSPRLCSPP